MTRCPECNARLKLPSDLELWDHVFCEACGVELEVIELSPLEIEVVYEVGGKETDELDSDNFDELDEELDLDEAWEDDDDDAFEDEEETDDWW